MKHGLSKYGYGIGLSMINDIFNANIIHIAGGYQSENKYGYLTMCGDFNKTSQS